MVEDCVQIILHPHNLIGIPLEDQHLFQIFVVNGIDLVWAARNEVVHGAIARDSQGKIQRDVTKPIKTVGPLEGEAKAAKLGLELAVTRGFREVILEGDSELVVKSINCWPQSSEWRIHSTVKEMLEVGKRLLSWQAEHVYSGANEIVHHLIR
ncbi:hypothetical protein CJ030_MR2G019445 [Morella rubra]|uniref:RNase H type-1 domain-containing protein n=1 Tax=Morella rubra TaxID=262757 RepID=A0A6A1WEX2_9ROSI|nr:hypothetical protein CJ030_MR2G019445 [Morella rubra]